jgi:hypothetical protein
MSWLGYYMLGMSLMVTIVGIGMAFSRKERERIQQKVMQELPERAAYLGSPEALKKTQRRGYHILVVGLALLIVWWFIFGHALYESLMI